MKLVGVPGRLKTRTQASFCYMMLLVLALSAHHTSSIPGHAGSYIAPLLVLLRNEDIWPACFLFIDAVKAAGPIIYIWLCLLLVVSGMSVLLLHGQYSTGDDYTDSQFRDFYHALSTMSVFLVDQGNFVEVVEPALSVHGLYVMFFGAIAVFSMFFVSAILLTLFMNTYSAGAGGTLTPAQRRKWAALTLTHLLCTRSIKTSLPVDFDSDGDRDAGGGQADEEQDMSPLMFEHLMLQCRFYSDMADSWIDTAQELIQESISLLHEHKGSAAAHYRHEAAALATVCCKLQFEEEYQIITEWFPATVVDTDGGSGPNCGAGSGSGLLLHDNYSPSTADCFQASQEAVLAVALVKTGLCSDNLNRQIDFVESILGETTKKPVQLHLVNTSVPLLSIGDSDSEEDIKSIFRTALKIDVAQRHQPDASIPKQQAWFAGSSSYFQKVLGQCNMLQLVHEMYRINISSHDPLTQNISALISLVHMHIWRCRLLFDGLDTDSGKQIFVINSHCLSLWAADADGKLQLVEFEKLWCFTKVSAKMAASKLLQKEAEVMLLTQEISTLQQDLQGAFL